MPFLTPEQVRKVRLKDSVLIELPRLEKKLLVVKISAAKANAIADVRDKGSAAYFMFTVEACCADESGELLTKEDAEQLFDLLSLEEVVDLMKRVTAVLEGQAKAAGKAQAGEGSATSSSASV